MLPNIVLYGDPTPLYEDAHDWVSSLYPGNTFLIIGTSYYTSVFALLEFSALNYGADVFEINDDAEHRVREFLLKAKMDGETLEEFLGRKIG